MPGTCDWNYLNEGNANIVVNYMGDDPKYFRKVARLRKISTSLLSTSTNYIFYKKVVLECFGHQYLVDSSIENFSQEELTKISNFIENSRKSERRFKKVDILSTDILISENLFGYDGCIAVEIKVKLL
jgi:hypothetical protein